MSINLERAVFPNLITWYFRWNVKLENRFKVWEKNWQLYAFQISSAFYSSLYFISTAKIEGAEGNETVSPGRTTWVHNWKGCPGSWSRKASLTNVWCCYCVLPNLRIALVRPLEVAQVNLTTSLVGKVFFPIFVLFAEV